MLVLHFKSDGSMTHEIQMACELSLWIRLPVLDPDQAAPYKT